MKGLSRGVPGAVTAIVMTGVIVFGIQTLTLQGQKDKKDSDVRVVNTPAEPVPVAVQGTPSVNVANVPAVSLSGTPVVRLSPAANVVTVGNSSVAPVPMRDVDRQIREPFSITFENFINDGQQFTPAGTYTVPAGKRLVLEYVSLEGYLPLNQRMLFGMSVGVNNQGTIHFLSSTHQGTFLDGATQYEEFVASQPVAIFVNAGVDIEPFVRRSAATGHGHYEGTLFGYLVDVQ